jgi:hypothetical protein
MQHRPRPSGPELQQVRPPAQRWGPASARTRRWSERGAAVPAPRPAECCIQPVGPDQYPGVQRVRLRRRGPGVETCDVRLVRRVSPKQGVGAMNRAATGARCSVPARGCGAREVEVQLSLRRRSNSWIARSRPPAEGAPPRGANATSASDQWPRPPDPPPRAVDVGDVPGPSGHPPHRRSPSAGLEQWGRPWARVAMPGAARLSARPEGPGGRRDPAHRR